MANKFRGEVDFEVGERKFTLCCTLQALAEIQTEMGVDGLAGVYQGMTRLSAPDLQIMLKALIRGGGHEISDEEFEALPLDPNDAMGAVGRAFRGVNLLPDPRTLPAAVVDASKDGSAEVKAAEAASQPNVGNEASSATEDTSSQADAKN